MAALILEESIDLDLKALAALTAYTTTSGIFYIEADQNYSQNAYVVYRKIKEKYPKDNKNIKWYVRNPGFSITCYSISRFDARKMANAVIAHYKDFNGKLGSSDGVIVFKITITGDADIGIIDEKYAVNIDLGVKYKSQ